MKPYPVILSIIIGGAIIATLISCSKTVAEPETTITIYTNLALHIITEEYDLANVVGETNIFSYDYDENTYEPISVLLKLTNYPSHPEYEDVWVEYGIYDYSGILHVEVITEDNSMTNNRITVKYLLVNENE